MGGHDHIEFPKVPDWRIYQVDDVPQLKAVQKALAHHGLRDPWLRNEVWKYTECRNKYPPLKNFTKVVFSGFKYGLAAAIVTTALEKIFIESPHSNEGHGDGGHEH